MREGIISSSDSCEIFLMIPFEKEIEISVKEDQMVLLGVKGLSLQRQSSSSRAPIFEISPKIGHTKMGIILQFSSLYSGAIQD